MPFVFFFMTGFLKSLLFTFSQKSCCKFSDNSINNSETKRGEVKITIFKMLKEEWWEAKMGEKFEPRAWNQVQNKHRNDNGSEIYYYFEQMFHLLNCLYRGVF